MSFRQGARQFFERRGAPPPPLPYDAEVEYLESTGTQYIDTGIGIAINLYCEVKFCFTVEPGSYENAPFGANNGRVWIAFASRLGSIKALYCGTYSSFARYNVGGHVYVFDDMDWHVAKIDSTGGSYSASFKLDDNEAFVRRTASDSVTNNMYLFGCNGTRITDRAKCRIGYCKIKSMTTNQLLADFIPVRFTNELGQSEGAMYDRVSGALFRNAGTGEFKFGTDIAGGGGYKWLVYSPLRFSRSTRLWKEAA